MLIDDDEEFLFVARKMLEAEKLTVDVARSGPEALARLPHRDYDVIFCDVHMPGMSGIQFYEQLRTAAPGAEKRLIMMTGDVTTETIWEFIEARHFPYVLKPMNAGELRKKIQAILGDWTAAPPPTTAAPAKKGAEARRHRRVAMKASIRVQQKTGGPAEITTIVNASKQGVFFLTKHVYSVGTDLQICFPYTGVNDIEQEGVIVRIEDKGKGQYGVAVALGDSALAAREFINQAKQSALPVDDLMTPRVVALAEYQTEKSTRSVALEDIEELKRQLTEERQKTHQLQGQLADMREGYERALDERAQAVTTLEELRASMAASGMPAPGEPRAGMPTPSELRSPSEPRTSGESHTEGTTWEFDFKEQERELREYGYREKKQDSRSKGFRLQPKSLDEMMDERIEASEKQALLEENARLRGLVGDFEALKQEMERLRKQLAEMEERARKAGLR